ncbi:hypothetical protein L0337_18765 [candidate division KSB1 bacterium]|nr:hypothetical protein [candidate division KSB1 bacterium]
MSEHLYLTKDNNDVISHCRCKRALIGTPMQADCPWCGCGWLFSCIECGAAFTFARAVTVEESWVELAKRDLTRFWMGKKPSREMIDEWIEFMEGWLRDVEPNKRYVYLDGRLMSTDLFNIEFVGVYARHDFRVVPHVEALKDLSILESTLSNVEYWRSRRNESLLKNK